MSIRPSSSHVTSTDDSHLMRLTKEEELPNTQQLQNISDIQL
uniref:Uncharacterized protein n=1 Tax=Onchocerca volvulus TaxID=6282 RepID=A0A8R1TWK5_ONCVO